jgi:hypothetical protein
MTSVSTMPNSIAHDKHITPQSENRPTRPLWWILLLIMLLGTILRLIVSPKISLWYDEANTLSFSTYGYDFLKLFNTDYNTDPPLFVIATRFWHDLIALLPFKPGSYGYDYALRGLPILFSILIIPATFMAGRVLFQKVGVSSGQNAVSSSGIARGDQAALFAAFLIAISPFQLFYAHELRCYSLFALLSALSLWAFGVALKDNRHRSWMLLALCLTLSFWNHFIALWSFICIDLFFLFRWRSCKKYLGKWMFWQSIAGIFCLPVVYLAFHVTKIVNNILYTWTPAPDLKTPFITFKTFFAGYSPQAWAYWPLFLLCIFLCLLGLWRLRHSLNAFLLLLLWTTLAILCCALLWRIRSFSFYEIRLFIASAISAALLVAFGWSALPRSVAWISAALVIILTTPLLIDSYFPKIHPISQHRLGVRHKGENRHAAMTLEAQGAPDEPVFHSSHFTLPPFRVYLPEREQHYLCLRSDQVEGFVGAYPNPDQWHQLDMIPVPVEQFDLHLPAFWLVVSWWEPFEMPQEVLDLERWFQSNFQETERYSFFAVTLLHFKAKNSLVSEQK